MYYSVSWLVGCLIGLLVGFTARRPLMNNFISLPSQLGLQNTLTAPLHRCLDFFNECPVYDSKHSNGEASVMLKLWRMENTPLMQLFQVSLWLGVVAPDRELSMGQIELNCVHMVN